MINLPYTLSKGQKQILNMILIHQLTVKEICFKTKKSHQYIYKIIKILKKKMYLKPNFKMVANHRGGSTKNKIMQPKIREPTFPMEKGIKKLLRLHNIQQDINILKPISNDYFKSLKTENQISISGVTIMLYEKKICMFTKENTNFYGYTTNECYAKAIRYFEMIFIKTENRLHVMLNKDQYLNKKWVRQHIAITNSDVAKDAASRKEKIAIKAPEDNKTWLITDKSLTHELEGIHPKTAKQDIDKLTYFLNDLRAQPEPPSFSKIHLAIHDLTINIKELIEGLKNK